MKKEIIGVVVIIFFVSLALAAPVLFSSSEVYEPNVASSSVAEIKVPSWGREVEPAWLQDADAVAAAEAVMERKALEAELQELEEIASSTNARIEEIQKELGVY